MRFLAKRLRWILVGAGAAWLLDPDHGAEHRQFVTERARALLVRAGLVASPSETATGGDVVTDAAWASAQYVAPDVIERRLAASGAR
jgi:hypothetical protein